MATNFPSSLDSFTNPSAADALDSVSVPHAAQHANLNDAMEAVQAKLGVGAGTIGEGTTFTPSWTNFTPGDGTERYKYWRVNELVVVQGVTIFGSTTSITGNNPYFALPVSAAEVNVTVGLVKLNEDGVGQQYALYEVISGSNLRLRSISISGSTFAPTTFNSSTPFTFGTGDVIGITLAYGAA